MRVWVDSFNICPTYGQNVHDATESLCINKNVLKYIEISKIANIYLIHISM